MSLIDFSKRVLALAPLAGYTDRPFRTIAKRFGADITFSEMISSNALVFGAKKSFKMIEKAPNETPYIVQIAGSDLNVIKEAVLILNDIEGIDGIDLNCGCPVPKIVSQDAGSSLLLNLPKLTTILECIKKYSNKPYTSVKVRLGFTQKQPKEIALACQNGGVDFISMHGRTRSGGYSADVDYEAIGEAKKYIKIPLLANGDITSYEKALEVSGITNSDGLMIGRGAVGKPWIFYQIKNELKEVSSDIVLDVVLGHYDAMIDFYGSEVGLKMFRKHLHMYSKGFSGATAFRDTLNRIDSATILRELIFDFFNTSCEATQIV